MAEIYGLFSGRDGDVRYVGMTAGDRNVRFKEHLRIASGRYITRVYTWIHKEWGDGFPVRSARLQWCGSANRKEVEAIETEWINKFPNLLNERKIYCQPQMKPPVIPEIREYRRRFIFNLDGLRGIHWWRDYDKFAVFIGGEWRSLGDELPGGSSSIFFSSPTDAVRARDLYLRGTGRRQPDIRLEANLPVFRTQLPDACDIDFDPSIHAAECDTAAESEFAGIIA
jgi:hypothetical protein